MTLRLGPASAPGTPQTGIPRSPFRFILSDFGLRSCQPRPPQTLTLSPAEVASQGPQSQGLRGPSMAGDPLGADEHRNLVCPTLQGPPACERLRLPGRPTTAQPSSVQAAGRHLAVPKSPTGDPGFVAHAPTWAHGTASQPSLDPPSAHRSLTLNSAPAQAPDSCEGRGPAPPPFPEAPVKTAEGELGSHCCIGFVAPAFDSALHEATGRQPGVGWRDFPNSTCIGPWRRSLALQPESCAQEAEGRSRGSQATDHGLEFTLDRLWQEQIT